MNWITQEQIADRHKWYGLLIQSPAGRIVKMRRKIFTCVDKERLKFDTIIDECIFLVGDTYYDLTFGSPRNTSDYIDPKEIVAYCDDLVEDIAILKEGVSFHPSPVTLKDPSTP